MAKLDSFLDETLEQFDLIMSTNIRAVYQLTQLAVPYLIESKGSIVNVSSILGAIAVSHMIENLKDRKIRLIFLINNMYARVCACVRVCM